MNLFILHTDPVIAAKYYCDLHVPKLVVECYQMLGSAVRKHGATDEQMPLTQKGTPLVGGYRNHPVTIWVSMSRDNYRWTIAHALALCSEFQKRFGKEHYCANGIEILNGLEHLIPEKYMADASGGVYQGVGLPIEKTGMTPFALAMPDEYRPRGLMLDPVLNWVRVLKSHATGDEAVQAYRRYYHSKTFAKWAKGRDAPDWWMQPLADLVGQVNA